MSETYHVRLTKEHLIFSAAHFITFNGDICERLHGHNYRVFAEVHGPLDENQYVIDFIALRDTLKEITTELDHHMLLPTEHPQIQVAAGEDEVEVTFQDRRWVFPEGDCILLPVANTTAELLARYLGNELLDRLEKRTGVRPQRLVLGVDENEGQWGVCELTG
ncbi:MAG: 6-pyruvoyl tetrahydropterin synthase family protein [Pirellulaceae bacterium]